MMPTTRAASIPSRSVMTSDSNTGPPPGAPGPLRLPGARLAVGRRRGGPCRARGAVAPDLVHVPGHGEALLPADLVLRPLDLPALELDDATTRNADHVVVVVPAEHRLVARLSVLHLDLVDQPRVHQARQRPVERGPGHGPPLAAEVGQELIRVEVAADPKHLLQDGAPLARQPEPLAGQVFREPRGSVHQPPRTPRLLLRRCLNYPLAGAGVSKGV